MAKFKLFLIISFLILLFSGCSEPQESAPILSPATLYDQMAQTICNAPMVSILYQETTAMTQGNNTYTYEDRQQLLLDTKTGNFQSSGTLFYGPHNVIYEKIYKDRTLYLTVNNGKFSGNYINLQNLLPQAGMFDEHTLDKNNHISFSDPDGSFWPIPANATVSAANGTFINSTTMKYSISYKAGNTALQTTVTLEYQPSDTSIPQPNIAAYTPIENVIAPMILEKAYGLLQQSTHVSGNYLEEASSQVNTLQYTHQLVLSRKADSGSVKNETNLINYSRQADSQTRRQTEEFNNGSYTISTDGNPPQTQNINREQFFQYFTRLLSEQIMAAKYITQANMELTDKGILLNISPNNALAENLYAHLWKTLYPHQDYLDQQLADHCISYHILIDPVSCLPLHSQLDFFTQTAIEGIPYPLTASQQLTILYA